MVDVDQEGAISAYFKLVQFKCKLAYSIKIKKTISVWVIQVDIGRLGLFK